MKLTPLDIRRQEFKRVVRGIDPEEVSVFLDMVAGEFERILRESKTLGEERDELKRKVDELDSMKEAIQGAVVMARKSSDEAVSQAKKEAELRLKEAEVESERMLGDARHQLTALKKEMDDIRNQRSILVGRIKSLLDGQTKMLEAYLDDWDQDEQGSQNASRAEYHGGSAKNDPAPRPWTPEIKRQPDPAYRMSHVDFLPNVQPDQGYAPEGRETSSRRQVPEIITPETEGADGPEGRLEDAPGDPGEGRRDRDARPRPLQGSGTVDRPHFLRPPRLTVDKE